MALSRGYILAGLLVVLVAASKLVGNAAAATYVVGDNVGGNWKVQSGGAMAFANWASSHVFRVGDVLVFNFTTGNHTVARVTRASYDACNTNDTITLTTEGPARLTLTSTGEDLYICTVGRHCFLGQKLAINVTASPLATAPSPSSSSTAIIVTTGTSFVVLIVSSVIYGFVEM